MDSYKIFIQCPNYFYSMRYLYEITGILACAMYVYQTKLLYVVFITCSSRHWLSVMLSKIDLKSRYIPIPIKVTSQFHHWFSYMYKTDKYTSGYI